MTKKQLSNNKIKSNEHKIFRYKKEITRITRKWGITMKLYERIENNNFDEIDKNRAIELIEGGNGHLVYNENYFKLQKKMKN